MARDVLSLLDGKCPPMRIVDIGAMDLDGPTPYENILGLPGAQVLGFEPNPEECDKLTATAPPSRRYLPYFIGDGTKRTFRWNTWNATSSLYEPNTRLLQRFSGLAELVVVKDRIEVQTRRLDDIPEARGTDFLKIDVQGATLDVIQGATKVLEEALVVHAEVEFVPLYEGQPLFADVDAAMRARGFYFHMFAGLTTRTFAPLRVKPNAAAPPMGQHLWADAVFVRSFLDLRTLSADSLLRLALIVERVYGSADLALLCLQHYDAIRGTDLWTAYITGLTGTVKPKPPLD